MWEERTSDATVLDRQIDSLDASAADAAAPARGAAGGDTCRETEDLLAVAVALFEHLKAGVRTWQASVKDWESDAWQDDARRLEGRYRKLQATFTRIDAALTRRESEGCLPPNANRFREAKLDLDLLCELSVDRMLKADESQHAGRGRPMAEVRDELRRRLGA